MNREWSRRDVLITAGIGAAGVTGSAPIVSAADSDDRAGQIPMIEFPISLNTSTLRGHKLPLTETIDIAAEAGYQGIEPWPDELDRHVQSGGSLKDIKQRLKDRELAVTGAIAFFAWMVDDDAERAKAFEEAKRRMDQLAQIGATHIAAPPRGDVKNVNLLRAAERYHDLLKIGDAIGVTPAVEIWGHAPNVYRLGQAALIAIESKHPKACILPDVFHLYKGGSGLSGVRYLSEKLIAGFHLNDYPADPPPEKARDADRVYPGDGVAPLGQLFRDLRDMAYTGALSIELFNPNYYQQDPKHVAETALRKTRAVMRAALG